MLNYCNLRNHSSREDTISRIYNIRTKSVQRAGTPQRVLVQQFIRLPDFTAKNKFLKRGSLSPPRQPALKLVKTVNMKQHSDHEYLIKTKKKPEKAKPSRKTELQSLSTRNRLSNNLQSSESFMKELDQSGNEDVLEINKSVMQTSSEFQNKIQKSIDCYLNNQKNLYIDFEFNDSYNFEPDVRKTKTSCRRKINISDLF